MHLLPVELVSSLTYLPVVDEFCDTLTEGNTVPAGGTLVVTLDTLATSPDDAPFKYQAIGTSTTFGLATCKYRLYVEDKPELADCTTFALENAALALPTMIVWVRDGDRAELAELERVNAKVWRHVP